MRRTWIYDTGFTGTPRKVWELLQEDRYRDPGSPLSAARRRARSCRSATASTCRRRRVAEGRSAVPRSLRSEDAEDRARSGSATTDSYESVVAIARRRRDARDHAPRDQSDAAELLVRDLSAKTSRPITTFRDPHPQLSDVQKQLVTYKRKDGVQLSGTLYLPPSYKQGNAPADVRVGLSAGVHERRRRRPGRRIAEPLHDGRRRVAPAPAHAGLRGLRRRDDADHRAG